MVEPISLALISGAAGLGMALGRLTRSSEPETLTFEFNEPTPPLEPANLQFFAVEDNVNPSELISHAKVGSQVFISIKKLIPKADKCYRFIHKLTQATEVHGLQLSQISRDLYLLNDREQQLHVRILKRLADDDPDLEDKLLHSSIAGY
ncbi:MAG: hypothetical protein ACXAE3_00570 [Candidatus Kariarchaeaceae archaeon]|jgi:hypothetical protein